MTRVKPGWFFDVPATSNFERFMKNNRPTQSTFKTLIDSLCFPTRLADAASYTSSGLVKIANYTSVLNRTVSADWPLTALVSHLPDIIVDSTGHTQIDVLGPHNGLSVTRYKHIDREAINYMLGVSVKNSIEVDSNQVQLKGDADVPGNSYYYGTNASGVKGYYALPTSTTATLAQLLYNTGTITINGAWADAPTLFDLASVELRTQKLRLFKDGSNIAQLKAEDAAERVMMYMRGSDNSNGVGGNIIIKAGDGSTTGGSVVMYPGYGPSNGGHSYIGYDPVAATSMGRIGIGGEVDSTYLLKLHGNAILGNIKFTDVSPISNIDTEVHADGKVFVLDTNGIIRTATYALINSKVSNEVFWEESGAELKTKNLTHTNINLGSAKILAATMQLSGNAKVDSLTVDNNAQVKSITIVDSMDAATESAAIQIMFYDTVNKTLKMATVDQVKAWMAT